MRKTKTAVIGCGMISHVYLNNMCTLFDILDVCAVCDLNEEAARKAAEKYGIPKVMTTAEVAADPEIELVINLTGPSAHYPISKQMLLAGKHVYSEKPLAASFEQAVELKKIAEDKGLRLGCSPDTILGSGIQTARTLIDEGRIGTVTSCIISIHKNQLKNAKVFTVLKGEHGTLPYDIGVYYIQMLLYLCGPASQVTAIGCPPLPELDPETPLAGNNLLVGAIRLKNGAVAAVHFNGNAVHTDHNLIQIVGTKGSLSLGDPNTFWGHVELTTEEEANVNIPLKFSCGRNGDSRTDIYGFRGIGAAEMAWSICKERSARCSGDLAVHTVEVLEALNISANTGRTVELTTEFVPQKPFDIELTRKDPAEYGLHSKEELLLQ